MCYKHGVWVTHSPSGFLKNFSGDCANGGPRVGLPIGRIVCDSLEKTLDKDEPPCYADRSPDPADLCLVRMSELHPRHTIIRVDEDLRVYRRNKREAIPMLWPPKK